jgi:erythronate-4-phosphate dehydrogenase
MKIIADENIPLVHEFFASLGEVITRPGRNLSAADLQGANALLVRSITAVNESLLAGSKVGFVGTCTIGVDHLDQQWLGNNDITFTSAPGCNANSVVEYVYAALCKLDIDWRYKKFGIIGSGNVGGLLYRRLKLQGVECYCYDPLIDAEKNSDLASLEQVLACDVISLHTPLTRTGSHPSYHLLNLAQLNQLKEGAVLLNCGRGSVINNDDLSIFLAQRSDVKVVLDVWEPEPNISQQVLAQVAIGTPHIAGYSYDGKLNGTQMIYRALCQHLNITPELSIQELVPALAENQLHLKSGLSPWAQVKQIVREVYDIGADHQRLIDVAAKSQKNAVTIGDGFDALRKNYPMRREFHNYQVVVGAADAEVATWLKALGFQLAESHSK